MYGLKEIPSADGQIYSGDGRTELFSGGTSNDSLVVEEIPKRCLVVMLSDNVDDSCSEFVRRFADPGGIDIHLIKPTTVHPGEEVRRMALALEIDWVCMVTRGGPGVLTLFLNRDDEQIIRSVPCPTISISDSVSLRWQSEPHAHPLGEVRRVLLPILGTHACLGAVYKAAAVAKSLGAVVDFLHVNERSRRVSGSEKRPVRGIQGRRREEFLVLAKRIIPGWLHGETRKSSGLPAFYATVRTAKALNCNLIVLGAPTRRWQLSERIDTGTERVLRGAPCPVFCIPEVQNRASERVVRPPPWLRSHGLRQSSAPGRPHFPLKRGARANGFRDLSLQTAPTGPSSQSKGEQDGDGPHLTVVGDSTTYGLR